MKKILIILLFVVLAPILMAQEIKPVRKIGKDKYYHVAVSFLATQAAYVTMRSSGANINDSRVGSLMFGFSVGVGKEYYDKKYKKPPTGFNKMDLFFDLIGIGLAGFMIHNYQS